MQELATFVAGCKDTKSAREMMSPTFLLLTRLTGGLIPIYEDGEPAPICFPVAIDTNSRTFVDFKMVDGVLVDGKMAVTQNPPFNGKSLFPSTKSKDSRIMAKFAPAFAPFLTTGSFRACFLSNQPFSPECIFGCDAKNVGGLEAHRKANDQSVRPRKEFQDDVNRFPEEALVWLNNQWVTP